MSPGSKIAMALFVLGLLTYLPYHVVKHDSRMEHKRLTVEVDNMKAGNEVLRRENERLRMRIEAIRSDPRLLERRARERLLMAHPEEKILVFPKEEEAPLAKAAAPADPASGQEPAPSADPAPGPVGAP